MPDVQCCSFAKGDIIDRAYVVQKTLGEGSFGRVFAATDPTGATVAVKLLKLWEVPDEIRGPLIDRFDMEFRTGLIDSPFLVRALSHGVVEGNPYLVMEYCPYGDLLTTDQACDCGKVAVHVLNGLTALHTRGKVHRDLKPENVLIKADGTFALTDFGISGDRNKRMTERSILGKPKQIFGTYAYMPPEQVNPRRDATVLPTTDIFSFGVMMYLLLTNTYPFGKIESEKDLVQYLRRSKAGDWDRTPLLGLADGKKWLALIEGCLHPDFHKRLQTCAEALALVPGAEKEELTSSQKPRLDYETQVRNGVLLRIMQGEEYGTVYYLNDLIDPKRPELAMGRLDYYVPNDVAVREDQSSYISRRHCTLRYDQRRRRWSIFDGQPDSQGGWRRSTNGTYVNSAEVDDRGMEFKPGDIISIGDAKLRAEAY